MNSEVDVAKSATRFGKKLPKSATRFGKNSPKSATRLVQKVPKFHRWTNQKMLLEGLITNSPGIKMSQKMVKKC